MNNTYQEYVVRCKTCNNQIACHVEQLEYEVKEFLKNFKNPQKEDYEKATENSLNKLNIYNWCCRIAITNPTIVFLNLHNILSYDKSEILTPDYQEHNIEYENQGKNTSQIELDLPTNVGYNTINTDINHKNISINCNSKQVNITNDDIKVVVLSGRTYLAR